MFNTPEFTSLTSTRKLIALFLQATPGQYTHKQIWEAIGTTDRSVTNALNCPDFRARFCQCLGVKKMHPGKPAESEEVKNLHLNEGEKSSPKPDLWRKNFTPPGTGDDTKVKNLHPGKVKNIHPPPKTDTPKTQSHSPITAEGEKSSPDTAPRNSLESKKEREKERKKEGKRERYADGTFDGEFNPGIVIARFCEANEKALGFQPKITGKESGTGKNLALALAKMPDPLAALEHILERAYSREVWPFEDDASINLPLIYLHIDRLRSSKARPKPEPMSLDERIRKGVA